MELTPIDQDRIRYLMAQYANSTCSRAELEELVNCVRSAEKEQILHQALHEEWNTVKVAQPLIPVNWNQMFEEIISSQEAATTASIHSLPVNNRRPFRLLRWSAAAVIILLAAGAVLWFGNKDRIQPADKALVTHDVAPGREGAVLTLSNGAVLVLDSAANGTIASQANVNVSKQDGSLVYKNNDGGTAAETMMNTLATPRGRQYQLVLPDGTKAWLNAASSIKYPAAFNNKERRVFITGEVYLEVAANAGAPFIVNTDKQELTVLGTGFNINAYNNEHAVRTTLLQGSVRIRSLNPAHNQSGLVLSPGQQAILNADGLKKQDTEAEQAIAWTKGQFWFHHASVEEVMLQLERWYDIEVVYQSAIPRHDFGGKLERGLPLSAILQFLEKSGIKYKLEQRTLTIMPD